MPKQYNQVRAMLAITKASLRATFRSPQSVFFSLFFPIVLIWIFGSLGGNGGGKADVAFEPAVDSSAQIYRALRNHPSLHFVDPKKKNIEEELQKGRIAAIIDVRSVPDTTASAHRAPYVIGLRTSEASGREFGQALSTIKGIIAHIDDSLYPTRPTAADVAIRMEKGSRPYRLIDFFLPGMIGFSLIGSAVFGISFLFYSLRETLVLKRMYATPVKRSSILLGEGLSKVIFNLLTVVVLIAFGHFMYDFHLAQGWITVVNMIVVSFIALLVFMGFGFFISGVSKNQNVIPIYANLFMFPQYFLSGTFFSRSALPEFLQPIIKFLPLTAVNDAMRNIAFEGASLASCWEQLLILTAWGLLIYIVTARVFRWE